MLKAYKFGFIGLIAYFCIMSNRTKQIVSIHADKANDESLRGVGK